MSNNSVLGYCPTGAYFCLTCYRYQTRTWIGEIEKVNISINTKINVLTNDDDKVCHKLIFSFLLKWKRQSSCFVIKLLNGRLYAMLKYGSTQCPS